MENTLNLLRNGAVGFIDWLDIWSLWRCVVTSVLRRRFSFVDTIHRVIREIGKHRYAERYRQEIAAIAKYSHQTVQEKINGEQRSRPVKVVNKQSLRMSAKPNDPVPSGCR